MSRILDRQRRSDSVEVLERSGRPRKSTSRQDRHLKVLRIADRFKTSRQLKAEWKRDINVNVSDRTVRRRLLSEGLRGCIAMKKPFISATNKKKRLEFARQHRDWTVDHWSRVLWTDESTFNMKCSDGAVYVRRRPGEELADNCTRKTVKHGGGNIMVWGCMAASGVGRL